MCCKKKNRQDRERLGVSFVGLVRPKDIEKQEKKDFPSVAEEKGFEREKMESWKWKRYIAESNGKKTTLT